MAIVGSDEGKMLRDRLGTELLADDGWLESWVGERLLTLGSMDGAAEIDWFSVGMEDGRTEMLGDSDGIDVGIPLFVGLVLGCLDG